MTVRTQQGALASSSIQYSRCIEAFLAHVPGLKVALPSCPADAYALLLAAIADNDPVVVIEHRGLYGCSGEVALDEPIERVGGARIRRTGCDVTVVALSRMVDVSLEAAQHLDAMGISGAEIAARAAEDWFWLLDASVLRVAAPDVPKPSAATLEAAVIPGPEQVVRAVRKLVDG